MRIFRFMLIGAWCACQLVWPGLTGLAHGASLSDVQITMPDALRALVHEAIEPIVRTARLDDIGDVQLLYRRLRPVIRDTLGAQGYFGVSMRRVRDQDDLETDDPNLVMILEPGEVSVIGRVDIQFTGHVAGDSAALRSKRESLRTQWILNPGQVFRQADWDASKNVILNKLLDKSYPAAVIASSLAEVDLEANEVTLSVLYDSGPAFTFGELDIKGLDKYPPRVVAGYNSIEPGDPYEQERLLQLLADLQNTVYFSSVNVGVDTTDGHERVPIQVTVVEADSQRIGLGGGYSSNTGFRSEVTYSLNNLFDRGYTLVSGARLEQKRQSLFADVFLPPTERGIQDSVGFSVDHQNVSDLDVERTSVGAIREYRLGVADFSLGLNFQLEERFSRSVLLGDAQALVAAMSVRRSRVDDRLNPTTGYVAFGQLAAASQALASDQDFIRLAGRYQEYWSIGRENLFSVRTEVGTVLADARRDVPQDFLFRAGGTNSVRGFEYLGLGVQDQGVLQGGRRLFITSLEYTRWVNGPLGVALFTDVGDVAQSWSSLRLKPAVGVGLRYRTPAGPIALDVAKARGEDKVRFHFALGVTF